MKGIFLKSLLSVAVLAVLATGLDLFRAPAVEAESCWDCVIKKQGLYNKIPRCCEVNNYDARCDDYLAQGYVSWSNEKTCRVSHAGGCWQSGGPCDSSGTTSGGGGGGPLLPTPDDCSYGPSGYCPAWCGECTWPGGFGF